MNKITKQFFLLEESAQAALVKEYYNRRNVLTRISGYEKELKNTQDELKNINDELKNIQEYCLHPLVEKEYHANTDEYGKMMDSGVTRYECPDCRKVWHEGY